MASLDGDWFCDEGGIRQEHCYAVWIDCDECRGDGPCSACGDAGGGYVCGYHDLQERRDGQS